MVAHTFTCPQGLYFNSLTDGCDFRRNVDCGKRDDQEGKEDNKANKSGGSAAGQGSSSSSANGNDEDSDEDDDKKGNEAADQKESVENILEAIKNAGIIDGPINKVPV